MQTAGKQSTLDLHQLSIDRTHQGITTFQAEIGGILIGQIHILVEIALASGLNDGVDDLDAAATLSQLLVGTDKLTELLETLVQTSIFCRRGEVADCRGVATSLRDGGLGWIVGGVVIKIRKCADQRIGVAGFAHAHLLARHELQRTVGAEMQHSIGFPDFLEVGVVRGESMVRTCAAGIQQTHRVPLVAEGGLNADEHVAEVAAEHQQVLPVTVEISGWLAPVLLKTLRVGSETLVFLNTHAVCNGEIR